jgi:hypothetical protein
MENSGNSVITEINENRLSIFVKPEKKEVVQIERS